MTSGFYTWGMMAAARRLRATSKPEFVRFVRAQTQAFLAAPRPDSWRGRNPCSEMEGLATAAAVLRAGGTTNEALVTRVETRFREGMETVRRLQLPPGASRFEYGGGAYLVSPKLRDFPGAFLESLARPYTRVDATAHCVSALVKLLP
jgi:hypothetical protein